MRIDSSVRMQVAVSLIPRLNSRFCLPLFGRCGGMEGFFLESDRALDAVYRELGVSARLFDRQKALREADRELEQIDRQDIRICSVESNAYPELLRHCEDAPLVFYYRGDIRVVEKTVLLAIVGTRRASVRCREQVSAVVEELARTGYDVVIVSGLAYGIDAAAHRASLECGLRTFAVLGHGLHMVYPAAHKNLAERILQADGALISECPCIAPVHPGNFLRRNRIVTGMCRATLVAESAEKGGAMSTARIAASYNRDVMAFPGRPDDRYSAGCNRLIKENTAVLVDNVTDVLHLLGVPVAMPQPIPEIPGLFDTGDRAAVLLQLLEKTEDVTADELIRLTSMPEGEVYALLLQLELEGKVLALPGKRYALRN